MRKLNYQDWGDLYDDIHSFAKGRLPIKKLDDESKFQKQKLKKNKKFSYALCIFMRQMY